jgi:Tfp pilus assembly protein PilP
MRVAGIMGSRTRVAIIEADGKTYIVRAGERIGEALVVSVLADRVVIKQNNVTFELSFGGAS